MDLGLQGRVALVTGGSKGIGQASALGLAREGADVAICARGQELLERVAAEMAQQTGRQVLPIVADMNREEEAQRFIQTAVQHFGRLDILVNCAGSSPGADRGLLAANRRQPGPAAGRRADPGAPGRERGGGDHPLALVGGPGAPAVPDGAAV